MLREGREALDTLTQLLDLGSFIHSSAREGAMDNFLALTLTVKNRLSPSEKSTAFAGAGWGWCAGTDAINATARRAGDFSGIHGNETAPVEMLDALLGAILTARSRYVGGYW